MPENTNQEDSKIIPSASTGSIGQATSVQSNKTVPTNPNTDNPAGIGGSDSSSSPKMVMVSEDALKELRLQLADLGRKVNATADQNKLSRYNEKENKKVLPTCKISFFRQPTGPKLVMGWGDMIANEAEYGPAYQKVDQRTVLLLRDESSKDGILALEVSYADSWKARFKEEVEILSTTVTAVGQKIFHVIRKDGEELDIDARFIN